MHQAGRFRTDIEGLRGLCVVAVVAFHAFPKLVPGGFVGVDAFFVLSGFLITGLLLDSLLATGRVDLVDFWTRRVRRILPAACLVLVATLVAACLIPGIDARSVARQTLAAGLFFFNWRRIGAAADYLAGNDKNDPVLHYWSLSVEEQFYVAYPLLLLLLPLIFSASFQKKGRWILMAGIACAWAASFAANIYYTGKEPAFAYFGTFTRAWQLSTGALLAITTYGRSIDRRFLWREIIGYLGLAIFLACVFMIDVADPYPGWIALAPTVAVAAVIFAGSIVSKIGPGRVLSLQGPCAVGRLSYAWYLWHWPFLVFGIHLLGESVAIKCALVAASFVAAALSYRYVEDPVRRSTWLQSSKRHSLGLGFSLLALTVATSVLVRHASNDEIPLGDGRYISAELAEHDRPAIYSDGCLLKFSVIASPPCVYGDVNAPRTVTLYGDSHAANWFEPLNAAAKLTNWKVVVRVKAACSPTEMIQTRAGGGDYPECAPWRDRVMAELQSLKPDLVVIGSASGSWAPSHDTNVIRRLAESAYNVIVLKDTPTLPQLPTTCLRKKRDPELCAWRYDAIRNKSAYPRAAPSDLPANAMVLDLDTLVCPDSVCRAVINSTLTRFDDQHLSATFSKSLTEPFVKILRNDGSANRSSPEIDD